MRAVNAATTTASSRKANLFCPHARITSAARIGTIKPSGRIKTDSTDATMMSWGERLSEAPPVLSEQVRAPATIIDWSRATTGVSSPDATAAHSGGNRASPIVATRAAVGPAWCRSQTPRNTINPTKAPMLMINAVG